jgi:hypothetical protein
MASPPIGHLACESGRHMGLADDVVERLRSVFAIESLVLHHPHTVQTMTD